METEYDFRKGKRGVIAPTAGKTRITLSLDDEILSWFRDQVNAEGGGNYQSLINEALCQHIRQQQETLFSEPPISTVHSD